MGEEEGGRWNGERGSQTPQERLKREVAFLVPVVVAVGLFGRLASTDVAYTAVLTAVFLANLTARFILANQRHDWAFFLLGVAAGGGNDLASMANGVYSYTSVTIVPFLRGLMPLWMVLFWGQVFLVFRKVFQLPWARGEPFRKDGRLLGGWADARLLVDLVLVLLLRAAIYRTHAADPRIPAAIYGGAVAARFLAFPPRRNEWYLVAILPYAYSFEGLMVTFGLYVYEHPAFLGLPAWLLLWWAFLVPCLLKEVFDRLEFALGGAARGVGGRGNG
ncbi:MAG: hypothetical protein Kow0069_19910 [Promethearchaeota archaeon]